MTSARTPNFSAAEPSRLWKSLLSGLQDFACIVDADARFVFVNRYVPQLKPKDVLGKLVYDFIAPSHRAAYRRRFDEVLRTGRAQRFETLALGVAGLSTWYETRLALVRDDGGEKVVAVIASDITERKEAEQKLRASERLFQDMFEGCREAIAYQAADGTFLKVNAAYERLIGYPREALVGKKRFYDVTPPEFHRKDRALSARLLREGGFAEFEKEYARADGTRVPAWVTVYANDGPQGRPSGFNVFIRDITQEKRAEQVRRHHEKVLELAQGLSAAANLASGASEALQAGLDRICLFAGWPVGHAYFIPEDGRGMAEPTNLWHLDKPKRLKPFRDETEGTPVPLGTGLAGRVWAAGEPLWVRDVRQDPTFRRARTARACGLGSAFALPVLVKERVAAILEFFAERPSEPDPELLAIARFVGVQLGRAIERERAERDLKHREELLRLLVAGVRDYAICMLGPRGEVASWSEGAERLFGYPAGAMVGRPLHVLYPEKEKPAAEAALKTAAEEGRVEAEGWQRRKDDTTFWANTVLTAMRDDAGGLRGFAFVMRDITERKAMEREVLEAGAREQRRIAQDLHDSLGQKLTGISLLTQALAGRLAARRAPETVDARKISDYAREAVRESRELAKGLMPAELGAGLPEALRTLAGYAREALRVECSAVCRRGVEAPDELAAFHLYRIAQEAVNNAVRHGRARKVRLGWGLEGDRAVLTVEDDGAGLPPAPKRRAGAGLGIMQYRARMMGATLAIRRAGAAGTIVACRLPAFVRA